MGLSRNKVAVSEGAAGSPPFYGERVGDRKSPLRNQKKITILTSNLKETNVVQYSRNKALKKAVSDINAEGPPVPIPNTEVKLCSGENTLLEAARENSSMPTQDRERIKPFPDPEKRRKSKPNKMGV